MVFGIAEKEAEHLIEQARASQKRIRLEHGVIGQDKSFVEELNELLEISSNNHWFNLGIGHLAPEAATK